MKFLAVFAFLFVGALSMSVPQTITYLDEDGIEHTDPLEETSPQAFAVDISKLHFMLYTKSNPEAPYELFNDNVDNLKASPFNPNDKTKVVIHGYGASYEADPPQFIKNAYLNSGSYNIILVDYKKYNMPYVSAVGSSKDIGRKTASLVDFLVAYGGLKPEDVHVIGHSLGSHIAGFVGQNVKFTLVRITGLDPAGPLFENAHPDNSLSPGDAAYIDNIHTSNQLGISKVIGNADFFPNGGNGQPECINAGIGQSLLGNCDHAASYKYFAESIMNKERYPARLCNSENDAKKNNGCQDSAAFMGDEAHTRSSLGIFYVQI